MAELMQSSPTTGGAASAAAPVGRPRVNLCGAGYYSRRARLLGALQALRPGEEVEVLNLPDGGLRELQMELEARLMQSFRWSGHGTVGLGADLAPLERGA